MKTQTLSQPTLTTLPALLMLDILFEVAVELEIKRLRDLITSPERHLLKRCREVIEYSRICEEALVQMAIRGLNIR